MRERVERVPRTRVVTDYKEERRTEQVPVTREVEDHYAVEVIKQYVAQYKPKVEIERVPYEHVWFEPMYNSQVHKREYTNLERPDLFKGQYEGEHIVSGGRKGEWQRIDARHIKDTAKVTLADGSVVDGARFLQMIRSNPNYLEARIIQGDAAGAMAVSSSGYAVQGGYSSSAAYPAGHQAGGGYTIGGGGATAYHYDGTIRSSGTQQQQRLSSSGIGQGLMAPLMSNVQGYVKDTRDDLFGA